MDKSLNQFRHHRIPKQQEDGSVRWRQLHIPYDDLMAEHHRKLALMNSWQIPMPHATGGLPGKTLLDNVLPHAQNTTFYLLDLQDAFSHVDIDNLVDTAKSPIVPSRYEDEIEDFIRNQASSREFPGLPQGAPCSPFLFNLYCLPMDRELAAFCDDRGIAYTRYLDDLTFSSSDSLGIKRRRALREIIERHKGMAINHQKSRLHHIHNGPVTITGVSLQPDGRIQASPEVLESARVVFSSALELGRAGLALTESEVGQLHGYHGAVNQLTHGETPAVKRLNVLYAQVLATLALK